MIKRMVCFVLCTCFWLSLTSCGAAHEPVSSAVSSVAETSSESETLATLPELKQLKELLDGEFQEIGAGKITGGIQVSSDGVEDDDDYGITATLLIDTSIRPLEVVVDYFYMTRSWSILEIFDQETGKRYYSVAENTKIYDIKTQELIEPPSTQTTSSNPYSSSLPSPAPSASSGSNASSTGSADEKEEFIGQCYFPHYEALTKEDSSYLNEEIGIKGQILENHGSYMLMNIEKDSEYLDAIVYVEIGEDFAFAVGDTITVYGYYEGMAKYDFGDYKEKIPVVLSKYYEYAENDT